MRRLLRRLRRWLTGERHGQHARPRGDTYALTAPVLSMTLRRQPTAGRQPWETAPMPKICEFPQWEAEARLRAEAPRLFAPAERYWGLRLVDFYGWVAWQAAERNRFRDECGLPRIELSPPSTRQLSAA